MNILLIILYSTILFTQVPRNYNLFRGMNADTNFEQGAHHNSIRHIIKHNSRLYLATSSGLGYLDVINIEDPIYYNINNSNLPQGGIPALKIYETDNESAIFLSGITSTFEPADNKYHHRGNEWEW